MVRAEKSTCIMWSVSHVEGYIRNIRLVGKQNITAYSICVRQSNFKISIRGRINLYIAGIFSVPCFIKKIDTVIF